VANSLLTIDMITREALRVVHEKAAFIGTINRAYDDSFAQTGGKIGSTLRIRLPNMFTRRSGSRVMNVQDQDERKTSVTVATQDGVDMRFNSAELALSIDDFSRRYIEPAASVLASNIDADCLVAATKATANVSALSTTATQYTTPTPQLGTVTSGFSDTTALGRARAKMNGELAPMGDRSIQMDSITMAALTNGNKNLFLPASEISRQYLEGYVGRASGMDFYENERVWSLTNSDDVTANTDADALVTDGATDATYGLVMDLHSDWAEAKQVVGAVFTVAGVYACHPETKQSLGYLRDFTVTSTSATTVGISPQIFLTGPRQNVCTAASAQCTAATFNEAAATFFGAASGTYKMSLAYHRDAFTFVTADLPLMADSESCVRRTQDGISMRVWKGSDIRNDELLMRLDVLWGFAALNAGWACRVW
jgi:hypothetical protein